MSTSKPIVLPSSSLDWKGAYGRWVQVVMVPELINAALAAVMSASSIVVPAVAPEMLVGAPAAAEPAADDPAAADVEDGESELLEPHAERTSAPTAAAPMSAVRRIGRERSFKITPCER